MKGGCRQQHLVAAAHCLPHTLREQRSTGTIDVAHPVRLVDDHEIPGYRFQVVCCPCGGMRGGDHYSVGGVAGYVYSDAAVVHSYGTGNSTCDTNCGSLVGYLDGDIVRSYGVGRANDELAIPVDHFDGSNNNSFGLRSDDDDDQSWLLTLEEFGDESNFDSEWFDDHWTMHDPDDDTEQFDDDFERPRLLWDVGD